jgi:hypothetical protein
MSTSTLTAGRVSHAPFNFFSRVAEMIDILRAAASVAAAVESRRKPAAADLKMLGIDDPEAVAAISARR